MNYLLIYISIPRTINEELLGGLSDGMEWEENEDTQTNISGKS